MQRLLISTTVFFASVLSANSLTGGLEIGSFGSDVYEARSTFVNPSALSYQSALNGKNLLSSFTYGYNKSADSEFELAFAYGSFGFGLERLLTTTQFWNRYSIAAGTSITSQLYAGIRYSVTGSESPALSGTHSVDLGVQYRPLNFVSFGLQANQLNRDISHWIPSVTLEPVEKLRISGEIDVPLRGSGGNLVYQASAGYEVLPGLELSGGYHRTYEYFAGLRFSVGMASIHSSVQPNSDFRRLVAGFDFNARPSRSFADSKAFLSLLLDSSLTEEGRAGGLLSHSEPALFELLRAIERAGNDTKIEGAIVQIESFPLGLAAAEEIHHALRQFREKGKPIHIFMGTAGLKEYLIASAATEISMEPSAELRFLGPKSERFYFKGTLDKLGIQGELLAKGEYKSAPESFTRKEGSSQSREATLAELKALEEGINGLLRSARKNLPAWNSLQQQGIYSAQEAKANGLIDRVASYRNEGEKFLADHKTRGVLHYRKRNLALPPRVRIIVADGDILQSRMRMLSLAGERQITPDAVSEKISAAVGDSRTKGLVVRVSSPGGEILASQEIASMVEHARGTLPVAVSMGDVAASGGYMISAPASRIFADELTLTGSIGVFLGKLNFEGLYKKIDLHKKLLGSSPYLGLFSESRAWTAKERSLMLHRLEDYYGSFVSFVAEKRGLKREEAEKAAKGRVWAARDALRQKLVDEKGGLREAVRYVAGKADLKEGSYDVEILREDTGFLGLRDLEIPFGTSAGIFSLKEMRDLRWMLAFQESPYLYLMNYSVP